MQRIMVDLPEPDGPHTTTRSFSATVSDTSRSTCIVPYHLLTLSSTIAGGALVSAICGSSWTAWLMGWIPSQRRWERPSSRSSPRLYLDMAKQNAK